MRILSVIVLAVLALAVVVPAYCAEAPQTAAPALISTITGKVKSIDKAVVVLTVKEATLDKKAEEKTIDTTGAKIEGTLAVGEKVEVIETAGKVTIVKVISAPKAPAVPAVK